MQIRTLEYTINEDSFYRTVIYSKDKKVVWAEEYFGPRWLDTNSWNDELHWQDSLEVYSRVYYNDSKITVMGNSENTSKLFTNDIRNPDKGFELVTINVESFFYQRSKRK
jgi:hypothetical protein